MKRTSKEPQKPNLTENKLAMRMFGPQISLKSARDAALSVAQHLPSPSVLEFLAQPNLEVGGATLCRAQVLPQMITSPTALFSELKLSVEEIPDEWMGFYADWMARLQRAHEFATISLRLECEAGTTPAVVDPIVAGLLLYLQSAAVDAGTRRQWLETALTSPAGSWLAAEGLHRTGEREQIVNGVHGDSRLLWAVSQISGLGRSAARLARTHLDLYGGLTLAFSGDDGDYENWLRTTALAGCECADAACAALVLQPDANPGDQSCWLAALQNPKHARYAFETVLWTKHTWPAIQWAGLRDALRQYAVGSAQWACHWFTWIEPEHAAAVLGNADMDLLWSAELLAISGVDDYAFRFRIGEQLDLSGYSPASLVLRWMNQRAARKENGTSL